MGQLFLGDAGHPLEVVMAGVAEVRGAEAEENRHGAAVPALVLKEVGAMLGAHLNQHSRGQKRNSTFSHHSREPENFLLGFESSFDISFVSFTFTLFIKKFLE